jgi:hypothetical protein
MSLFHRHQWQEIARRFVPPPDNRVRYSLATEEMVYDLVNGYTVVELRCTECGKVSSEHIQGDAT